MPGRATAAISSFPSPRGGQPRTVLLGPHDRLVLIERLYVGGLAVFIALGFYTNLFDYFEARGTGGLVGKAHLVFIAMGAPALLIRRHGPGLLRVPLAYWAVAFVCASIVAYSSVVATESSFQILKGELVAVVELLIFLAVFATATGRWIGGVAVIVGSVVTVAMFLASVFGLIELSITQATGRAAGLHINPNQGALVLTLGMLAALPVLKPYWRVPFVGLVFLGVLVTWSRAGILGLVLVVALLVWTRQLVLLRSRLAAVAGLALLLGTALLVGGPAVDEWNPGLLDREAVSTRLDQLRTRELDLTDRLDVAVDAWLLFLENPLEGKGLGATRDARVVVGPHNMYLMLAAEYGLAGLVLMVCFFLAVGGRRPRGVVAVGVIYLGFAALFTHNLFDHASLMVPIGLLGGWALEGSSAKRFRGQVAGAMNRAERRGAWAP